MKSLRNYVYAAALAVTALNFAPSLASAQDVRGNFTLSHDVRWQNAVVPAGTYRFKIEADGPAEMLTLTKVSGHGAGFMFLVNDTEDSKPSDTSQLILVKRSEASFVSAMELPEFGVTLHFTVPSDVREVALAATPAASAAR
jgi:hypothetical protein